MDISAQLDELDSLKSIYYNEEFQVINNPENNKKIQAIFWAYCKLPDGYTVKYFGDLQKQEPSYLNVKHLPPIELRLTFPVDYPSKNPPEFVISCKWLPKAKISLLCKKLDEIWSDYGAVEIVYVWCDFLKNDSLNFLGYENELDLRKLCCKHLSVLQKKETEKFYKNTQEGQLKETNAVNPNFINKSLTQDIEPENNDFKSNPQSSVNVEIKSKVLEDNHNKSRKNYCGKTNNENKIGSLKPSATYKNKWDERAVLDLSIATSPIQFLENYDAQREKVQFLRNFYTCNICFSDKLGKDCTKFKDCNHVFCISCINTYFTVKIKDGTVQSIKCPEDKCNSEALPSQIKEIVSEELFARYDAVLLNTALDTLTDIIYCPRQLCQYPVSCEPEEKMASCPNCQYVFCVTCKMVYHGVEPCQFKSAEVQKLIEQYEKGNEEVRNQMEKKYGKKRLETVINNSKAEAWIKDNSKSCPRCGVAIEKAQGCNKMVCWKCNAYFCWLCNSLLDIKNPYLHFRDPHSQCANKLFYMVEEFEDEEDDWDWVEDNADDFLDTDFEDDEDFDVEDDNEEDENDLTFLLKPVV